MSKPLKKVMPEKEWLASLPTKRVATQGFFMDKQKRLLVVKPNYRDYWLLPGGIVEENESPMEGMLREIKEELGFEPDYIHSAGCDYRQAMNYEEFDFLHFLFDGGLLSDEEISNIVIEEDEIDEFKFVPLDELDGVLVANQLKAARTYYESAPTPVLMHNGERVNAVHKIHHDYQMARVAAAVVLEKDGKYLLLEEKFVGKRGMWQFPAGKCNVGESPESAAVRETKEEIGLDIELVKELKFNRVNGVGKDEVHIFEAKVVGGELKLQEDEISAAEWFSLDEIKAMEAKLVEPITTITSIEELENDR